MRPTPVFLNPSAGGAGPVLRVLEADPRVSVRRVSRAELVRALEDAPAGDGVAVVAGGDGTLSAAAGVLAGRDTVLGIVPAGTLNHFARGLGLPMDPEAALEVALGWRTARVDVARLDGRTFLNTSSAGAYPAFVRSRERWAGRLGYYGASVVAGAGSFVRLRSFDVEVEVEGAVRRVRTPLVFVGVGERVLRPGRLGARREGGRRALHVLVVRPTRRLRLLGMGLRTLLRGIRPWAGDDEVESLLVERCTVRLPDSRAWVGVDGNVVRTCGVLEYTYRRDALRVRVPWDGTRIPPVTA